MPLIDQREQAQIKESFRSLGHDLNIIHFTQRTQDTPLLVVAGSERHYYKETCDLLEEVASLSEKIRLQIHDLGVDAKVAEKHHIGKIPGTALIGARDYGVRFYGIPSGYEFSTFIQAIIDVSRGTGGLSKETRGQLQKINEEMHIQVFVTPR